MSRTCNMALCPAEAAHTLTYDYETLVAVIGPLSPEATAVGHDLCAAHSQRWVPPQGWELVRYRDVLDGR